MNKLILKIAGAFSGGAIGSLLIILLLFITSGALSTVNFAADGELNGFASNNEYGLFIRNI